MSNQNDQPKVHRIFHYDEDGGQITPVEEVKLQNGRIVLVPVQLDDEGKRVDSQNKPNK